MALEVKICGIQELIGLQAVIDTKADYIGFVFHKTSRHLVSAEQARALGQHVPSFIKKTGLLVDASDEEIRSILATVDLDLLQLHGNETPARVADIRSKTGKPVMVALRISKPEHLAVLSAYEAVADRLLFDSRSSDTPTGGTGKSFDWNLLKGRTLSKPWMLAGGLKASNLAEAVRISGAKSVDVSSGVEDAKGHKNPDKIREFITLASQL